MEELKGRQFRAIEGTNSVIWQDQNVFSETYEISKPILQCRGSQQVFKEFPPQPNYLNDTHSFP